MRYSAVYHRHLASHVTCYQYSGRLIGLANRFFQAATALWSSLFSTGRCDDWLDSHYTLLAQFAGKNGVVRPYVIGTGTYGYRSDQG